MNAIICFIIGFLLAKFFNYIDRKRMIKNIEIPKTLNIGNSDDIVSVTSGMLIFEIYSLSDIHNFDLENIDDVIFYISSTNKYIYYKDKDFRYIKLDIPLR